MIDPALLTGRWRLHKHIWHDGKVTTYQLGELHCTTWQFGPGNTVLHNGIYNERVVQRHGFTQLSLFGGQKHYIVHSISPAQMVLHEGLGSGLHQYFYVPY